MTMEIILNGRRVVATSGAVKHVVREMDASHMDLDGARAYLLRQGVMAGELPTHPEWGDIDFDNLTNGRPTVHGRLYERTEAGMRLTGQWEQFLRSVQRPEGTPGGSDNLYSNGGPRDPDRRLNTRGGQDSQNWYGRGGCRQQPAH